MTQAQVETKGVEGKRFLGITVLEAAKKRIAWLLDEFPRACVAFSGGKDSTVLLHLVAEAAREKGCRVGAVFLDWEAQFDRTIKHVETVLDMHADVVDPYWLAVPVMATNGCSVHQPEWEAWAPEEEYRWVRKRPSQAWEGKIPGLPRPVSFEDLVCHFAEFYAQGQPAVSIVGVRTQESLTRWRAVTTTGTKYGNRRWVNKITRPGPWKNESLWSAYPIYDWKAQDVWAFHGKTGLPHNTIYDLMHQAGLTIHQMRIFQPYGTEQRRGLWLYHVLEPKTWGRVVARVSGINSGALYGNDMGNITGNVKITKPDRLTWSQFAELLLRTMPPATGEHYRNKIAVFIKWHEDHGVPRNEIQDCFPGDTAQKGKPSWRRVCKVLLRNDYWCRGLSFSQTKPGREKEYMALMKKRREKWGIW